jgi:1-deoxy-D-xylulose-5-phosphate synthase
MDKGLKIRPLTLPDRFIDHGKPDEQYDEAGLSARHSTATALAALGQDDEAGQVRA